MSIPFGSLFVLTDDPNECPQCTWFVSLGIDMSSGDIAHGQITLRGKVLEVVPTTAQLKSEDSSRFLPVPGQNEPDGDEFVRITGVPVTPNDPHPIHISTQKEDIGLVHTIEVLPK